MLWFLLGTLALLTGSWLMAARMALKKLSTAGWP